MNATSTHRTGRAALFALVLLLITTAAFSQNILVTTATSVTGTGTIKLAGHLIDSSTTAKTLGGILQLTGTSTTQNIGTGLANGLTIDSLVMAGTTDTALLGQNISVDSLAVNSGLLTVNNKTLTIAGKTSHSGGSLVANAASDSVAYTSGSAQKLVDATYTKLSMSGAGAKSLNGTVSAGTVNHSSGALTVDNPFTVTTSGAFGTVADVTSTLTINGSTTNSITTLSNVSTGTVTNGSSNTLTIGTVTTTGASGTISTSAADLTITTLSGNNGTIKTSGAGNLNFTNGATNAGVITDSVGSATGNLAFGASLNNQSGGRVTTGGASANLTIGTTLANAGTIKETGAGTITVTGAVTLNSGFIDGTGGGLMSFNGAVTNSDTILSGSGGASFGGASVTNTGTIQSPNGALTFTPGLTNAGGHLTLTGTGAAVFNANFVSAGTLSFSNGSLVTYQGTTTTVQPTTYGSLTLSGSSDKTASANVTLASNLVLTKNLTMNSTDTLKMSSATGTNVTGVGEVTGAVQRTNALSAGIYYAFNADSVGLAVKNASSSKLTINMQPNVAPSPVPSSHYANRSYTLGGSVASDTLSQLDLQYANAELVNVSSELKLGAKSYNGTNWSKVSNFGGSYTRTVDSVNNIVSLTGVASGLGGVTELGVSTIATQSITTGLWSAGGTWDEGSAPGANDDVELYNANVVTNDAGQFASSVTFYNTSSLVINNSLTVGGLVDVNSTTGNLTINTGKTLTITPGAGNNGLRINGTLTNNGTIDIH